MTNFPVPPTQPGALMLAGLAFSLLVLIKRLRTRRATSGVTRDRWSIVGLVLQGTGIALAAVGGVDTSRALGDPVAIVGTLMTLSIGLGATWLFARSAAALGANWSLVARTSDAHQLIRSGPFARVRHPIYSAIFLFACAVGIGLGHYWQLLVALPVHLAGTLVRIRIEERLLRARFGAAYDDYVRATPALIPRF